MRLQRNILCFFKIIGAVVMAVAVTGCGTARLAYSNGETLSYWWLDRYIDISAEQAPMVKNALSELFAWHRETQLPDYVQWLQSLQGRILGGATSAPELRSDRVAVALRLQRMTDHAVPALAALARSLQPAQIVHIQKKFDSNNDTYRKDFMRGDADRRQQRRFKKTLEQAEYWFGDFGSEQEATIRAASNARPHNPEWVLADRMRRQASLVTLLSRIQAEKVSQEQATSLIEEYLKQDADRGARPERKEFFDRLQEANLQTTLVIINCTTSAQRSNAIARAQQWIDDFSALAGG